MLSVQYQWTNPKNGVTYDIVRPRPEWHNRLFELHKLGLNDGEIGRLLDRKPDTVRKARIKMGLPANAPSGCPMKSERMATEDGD